MKTLPAVNQAEDATETLALVCDALGIGELARSRSTILMNVENARRRSDCLWKIEHEFFMVSEPDEDEPEGPPFETCLLNWGDDPDQYVKKCGEVFATGRAPDEFLEQIRRSCDVAGYESNDGSLEQKRWFDLRDQAARILASREMRVASVSEPADNEDTILEAVKRIDQLGVKLCKSLTLPGIDRMAAGMDFHNAVETELRRMLASRPVPVAFGAEPELRRILREVTAVAITQLFEAYQSDTVAEFTIEELQLVSDASRALRPEQVEHVYRRGFDLTLAATASGGAGCSVDVASDDYLEGVELLQSLMENIERHGNYSKESTLVFLNGILHCLRPANPSNGETKGAQGDEPVDFSTLGAAVLLAEESGVKNPIPNPASEQGHVSAVLPSEGESQKNSTSPFHDPCPDTGRRVVTVAQWEKRPDTLIDTSAYWFSPDAEDMGMDPWSVIDGIDKHTEGAGFDVWFANDQMKTVTGDQRIYVAASHYDTLHIVASVAPSASGAN